MILITILIRGRIKMRLYWIRVGPKSNESILVRNSKGKRDTGKEAHMKMETDLMLSQTKEY